MTMQWAGVVSWVLDGHVLKDRKIGSKKIVHPGPHQPPLFHHHPQSLISIPSSPSREEVCGDVLKPHRCHHHCDLLVKSQSACSLHIHIEVSHKNQLCPHVPLHHLRHHIPNRCVVERCQVMVPGFCQFYVSYDTTARPKLSVSKATRRARALMQQKQTTLTIQ